MTEKIAEIIKEGIWGANDQSIASTHLSNGYIVSTIQRGDLVNQMDSMISTIQGLTGITTDDLAERTEDGFRADLSAPGNYETMVFACDEDGEVTNWEEKAFLRYMSREEAEEGHKEMVEKWRRM